MMEGRIKAELETQFLVSRLFERLRTELPNYDWDDTVAPYHSVRRLLLFYSVCYMLIKATSLMTIGTSTVIAAPRNPPSSNLADPRVGLPTLMAAPGITQEKEMRNTVSLLSRAFHATPPVWSASSVSLKN